MNKINIKILLISAFVLFTAAYTIAQDDTEPMGILPDNGDTSVSMEKFKSELSPQGEWFTVDSNDIDAEGVQSDPNNPNNDQLDSDETGYDDDVNTSTCWRPNGVDYDWNPYSCGTWVYTDCGWCWNSCDPWGAYTCHYGRWWWSTRWGWVWSPGYLWAPCWVSWRNCGDYWGWYPLSPRIRCRGHFRYDVSHYRFNHEHWTFVGKKNFTGKIDKTSIVKIDKNSEIMKNSRSVSNVFINKENKVINRGPNVTEIEKTTGTKITPKNVSRYNDQNKNFVSRDKGLRNETKTSAVGSRYRENTQKRNSNDNGYRPNNRNGRRNNGTTGRRNNGHTNNGSKSHGSRSNGSHSNGSHSNGSHSSSHGSKSNGSSHKTK